MSFFNSLAGIFAAAQITAAPLPPPVESQYCTKPCDVSAAGRNLTKQFEGFSPFVYKDVAGYPTIGHGHLIKKGEKFTEPMLPDVADLLLQKDMATAVRGVNRQVKAPTIKQNRFDALASFTFNLGEGALKASTLLKKVNAALHLEVPAEFRKYIYAGGKIWKGLVNRRNAEAILYAQ